MTTSSIQYFNSIDEKIVLQIRLTKRKSGHAGQTYFRFENLEAVTRRFQRNTGNVFTR